MRYLDSVASQCPYCGEKIELVIDVSQDAEYFIEDCEVCCKPIVVHPELNESHELIGVQLATENDVVG